MKTRAVSEDEDEPRKMRSSRSKRRRHTRRTSSTTESESPPRKRSKKPSRRTLADKKSKLRSKVNSSSSRRRRRRRSPSLSPSLSSSNSPSTVSRSCSTCSSSSSEQSVSPPPPRSRSRDVKKRKGRGRDRERRKTQRSTSSSSSTSSSRSRSSKRWTKDSTARDKIGKDYYKNVTDSFDKDEEALVSAKKGRDHKTERHDEKTVSLEKIENPPSSKNANETEDILTVAGGGSPVAEDLELILRHKALENFIKFRAAAAMSRNTDNGAIRKETLTDSPQNAVTKVTEIRSASVTPFLRQASSLGARHPTKSTKSMDCGKGTSPRMWSSSGGMSHGAGSRNRTLKDGDTGRPTQQQRSITEATHSTSQRSSPQDVWNSSSVMQRLVHTPGSASSVTRRLGNSAGVSHVNAAPRIKSVVSIPTREELDGGSSSPQRACENPALVENSGEFRHTSIDISTKAEGTNGGDRKMTEPSASNGAILSSVDGKTQGVESRIEDTDGSQLQKKTFSRMQDGETVEVSYKVYIPKKTPALARRKLQR